jgi:hypothetical protein
MKNLKQSDPLTFSLTATEFTFRAETRYSMGSTGSLTLGKKEATDGPVLALPFRKAVSR